jgi:hypothetical protein
MFFDRGFRSPVMIGSGYLFYDAKPYERTSSFAPEFFKSPQLPSHSANYGTPASIMVISYAVISMYGGTYQLVE